MSNVFFDALNCLSNEQKNLFDINTMTIPQQQILQNENYGLSIIGETEEDLQLFKEFFLKNFLPISNENCYISSTCTQNMIDHYLNTGINHIRSEYVTIILLKNVQYNDLSSLTYEKEFFMNNKNYKYQLQIVIQDQNQSQQELLTKIRDKLLGEKFFIEHDDHESIPSLPAPKQPQFVSIFPHTQIACWPLPRRRDLNRFRQDLGVTHILTLLNNNEINHSNICKLIKTHGIQSLHIPIEGANLSVFTSSQSTIDLLIEQLPSIRDLLLNSTETQPVKMIIHCAAGLHRTGTITYLLLRLCHFSIDQALLIINRTRAITARQVGQKRIHAAEYNLLEKIP